MSLFYTTFTFKGRTYKKYYDFLNHVWKIVPVESDDNG